MRVLVVEDDPLIGDALAIGLGAEGFVVDLADRGDDGLWMATENDYDAIVLDVMLPGRNGYEICRELRAAGDTTPILMLTAKDGELDEAEGLDTGADDWITKPFSFVVLLARLRAILRRGAGSADPVLRAGDLALDPAAHTCRRGDTEIELTRREFELLAHLLHARGRAVTKRELLSAVWGDDEADPAVVGVYVGYLRRKVDEPFGAHAIETVRGVGYRLATSGGTSREHRSP